MSDIDVLVKTSKKYEGLLETFFDAKGKGLSEKSKNVSHRLPEKIFKALRHIAYERNQVMHVDGVDRISNLRVFEAFEVELDKYFSNFNSWEKSVGRGVNRDAKEKQPYDEAVFPLSGALISEYFHKLTVQEVQDISSSDPDVRAVVTIWERLTKKKFVRGSECIKQVNSWWFAMYSINFIYTELKLDGRETRYQLIEDSSVKISAVKAGSLHIKNMAAEAASSSVVRHCVAFKYSAGEESLFLIMAVPNIRSTLFKNVVASKCTKKLILITPSYPGSRLYKFGELEHKKPITSLEKISLDRLVYLEGRTLSSQQFVEVWEDVHDLIFVPSSSYYDHLNIWVCNLYLNHIIDSWLSKVAGSWNVFILPEDGIKDSVLKPFHIQDIETIDDLSKELSRKCVREFFRKSRLGINGNGKVVLICKVKVPQVRESMKVKNVWVKARVTFSGEFNKQQQVNVDREKIEVGHDIEISVPAKFGFQFGEEVTSYVVPYQGHNKIRLKGCGAFGKGDLTVNFND